MFSRIEFLILCTFGAHLANQNMFEDGKTNSERRAQCERRKRSRQLIDCKSDSSWLWSDCSALPRCTLQHCIKKTNFNMQTRVHIFPFHIAWKNSLRFLPFLGDVALLSTVLFLVKFLTFSFSIFWNAGFFPSSSAFWDLASCCDTPCEFSRFVLFPWYIFTFQRVFGQPLEFPTRLSGSNYLVSRSTLYHSIIM